MNCEVFIFLVFAIVACYSVQEEGGNEQSRHNSRFYNDKDLVAQGQQKKGRFFSIFTLIRFDNVGCNGTSSTESGICLTRAECNNEGGSSLGSCASGFGVCCQLVVNTCGGTVNKNCTYIQNPNYPGSESGGQTCSYTINKCSDDICYYKLSMEKNTIAEQDTTTADTSTKKGTCLTDQMTTSCSDGTSMPDNFCGDNDNQHVYLSVQSLSSCQLNFILGTGSADERAWRIKISQIECDNPLAPPAGCLQYFYERTGTICSFSFKDEPLHIHLNNQRYSICIRMELGMCSITYAPAAGVTYPFRISGPQNKAGASRCSTDYISIPNGQGTSTPATTFHNEFCGERFGGTHGLTYSESVTTSTKPFNVEVYFQQDEGVNNFDQGGFCLDYTQNPC